MPEPPPPADIQSRDDVHAVVSAFYRGIAEDPLLGPYFASVDLDAHVPRLVAFWTSIVFQSGTYRGRPFDAHAQLEGLQARHFRRWLQRFEATVDARFAGPRAARMKQRARQIATVFQSKLGVLEAGDGTARFNPNAAPSP
ncbi:group III truncated hemoglobin [Salisaeta longa]|uniref:group III truncated hemoglobin n=1 Tax=Salisaeta longa TaxID=503170 RepID=UPI0003B707F6|nr:group III truncated hemoglobin [Salisaeta longa]